MRQMRPVKRGRNIFKSFAIVSYNLIVPSSSGSFLDIR
jgi:hypothetical protein